MCSSRQPSKSNGQRSQSQNSRFSCKDHHELEPPQTYDDSKWYSYEQESVRIQFTSKHLYHTKPMNVMFDEIDQENMPRVLADLHVSQCNGPKDSLAIHDVHVKCFKVDSGTCGNLIPLSLYLDLFPNSSVRDLQSTIDHRVQLVVCNKNLIKQYGTCYLKIRSSGHVHICKFYVVDSHFNLIIGVGSCLKLELIQFQNPVYTGWSDDRPVSIGRHVDAVETRKNMKTGDVLICTNNAKPMEEHPGMQTSNSKKNGGGIDDVLSILTKDWIVSNPKYKHLFTGISCFKCDPVKIEMKPDAEPVRKAPRRVPLALKEKFTKEIQFMVDSGFLTKVTPGMPTPEWLNSSVIVKKPNGNLRGMS